MILETHKLVDVVVLMLGTNDCKTMYDTSAEVIGEAWSGCSTRSEAAPRTVRFF